jgi:hypothetical protein
LSHLELGIALLAVYLVSAWPLWRLANSRTGVQLIRGLAREFLMLAHIALLLTGSAQLLQALLTN